MITRNYSLGCYNPPRLKEMSSRYYERGGVYRRGYMHITTAEENLGSWSGENPQSPE
jgi:hypothetical protein